MAAKLISIVVILPLMVLACVAARPHGSRIDAADAVALAEAFIARNGYTDAPAERPITFESFEWTGDELQLLAMRRNTLRSNAYGYSRYGSGWLIFFRYSAASVSDDTGRGVTMDADGQNLRAQHQEAFLSAAQVVLEP